MQNIPKGIQTQTDNAMATKDKKTTAKYKTQRRKPKTEQHKPLQISGDFRCCSKHGTVVLLIYVQTR